MPQVSETIPDRLQPRVDAALNWFNASSEAGDETFKVTGILDADKTLEASDELQLILCGGDRCEQRTFRVSGEVEPLLRSFDRSGPICPSARKAASRLRSTSRGARGLAR